MIAAARPRVDVFAVEDTTAQLVWVGLTAGKLAVEWDGHRHVLDAEAHGALDLDGLRPGADVEVTVRSGEWSCRRRFRTLDPPPGPELYRFATISDLHIGRHHFGLTRSIREHDPDELHPSRCARSAIEDLARWGAQRLVVKGDIVDSRDPQAWIEAAEVLASCPVPTHLLCGNHDRAASGHADPFHHATLNRLDLVEGIEHVDVPGARLILMDSAVDRIDKGRWDHHREPAVALAADAAGPVIVLTHHHPQRFPVPTFIPHGVPSHLARPLIEQVAAANPAVLGTSGHTHRNRHYLVRGVPWTEVGSTKDYPGVWAGYVIHEGGVRQVVRRVSRPDCLAWTEQTRRCALGVWALWSPGRLGDRCFTWRWPTR